VKEAFLGGPRGADAGRRVLAPEDGRRFHHVALGCARPSPELCARCAGIADQASLAGPTGTSLCLSADTAAE